MISKNKAVLMTVGAMVGSAIFTLSGVTIAASGVYSILAWIIAGVVLLGYGILCSILAASFKKSGGMFLFPALILSKNAKTQGIIGFVSSWIYFFGCFAGVVFASLYFGFNLSSLLEIFKINFFDSSVYAILSILLALLFVILKLGKRALVSSILTVLLIICLTVFVIFIWFFNPFANLANVFKEGNFVASFSQIPIAMLAYGSIIVPAFFVDKIQDGVKSVFSITKRAMFIVMTLYIVVIFTVLSVVNMSYFSSYPNSVYSPLIAAVDSLKYSSHNPSTVMNMSAIVIIATLLALFTTQIIVLELSIDSLTVAAENNQVFAFFKNRNITASLIVVFAIISYFFASSPTSFINMGALFNALFIILICFCGFYKLTKNDDTDYSSSQVLVYKIMSVLIIIAIIICSVFEIITDYKNILITSGIYLLIGLVLFILNKLIKVSQSSQNSTSAV